MAALSLTQKATNALFALRGRPPKYLGEASQVGHPDLYGDFIDGLSKLQTTLQNTDSLVAKRGYKTYDDMIDRDPTISSGLGYRAAIMLSPESRVKPADEKNAEDRKWADFVEWNYEHMDMSLDHIHYHMTTRAQGTGIYIGELIFYVIERGPWAGMIGLKTIKQRYPDSFEFRPDAYGNLSRSDSFVQVQTTGESKPLDPNKFVIYPFGFRDSNWWGNSRLRPAYKYYHLRDYIERYVAVYANKHGGPTIGLQYPPGTPTGEVSKAIDVAKKLKDMGIHATPSDWAVMLQSPSSVHSEFFSWATAYCNKMIVKAMMVPELVQSEGEKHGSYKLGQVQIETVFVLGIGYDSKDLEDTFHRQVTRRLIDLNDPNGQVQRYPRYQRDQIRGAPDANMLQLSENIAEGKWPQDPETSAWFARRFGMPRPPEIKLPKPPQGGPPAPLPGSDDTDDMANQIREAVFSQMEESYTRKGRFAFHRDDLVSELQAFTQRVCPALPLAEAIRQSCAETGAWIELLKHDTEQEGIEAFANFKIDQALDAYRRRLSEL